MLGTGTTPAEPEGRSNEKGSASPRKARGEEPAPRERGRFLHGLLPPELAPTPKDVLLRDGTAQLYRFRREGAEELSGIPFRGPPSGGLPLLLVPSLINRWYVLDLRRGASLATALVEAGIDTWCLDWGAAEDEDRYLTWDDVLARLGRMVRKVKRATGAPKVGLLGYCLGGTLTSIWSALHPDDVACLANLAGPIDFSEGGFLAHMTDRRWFDPAVVAAAGNVGSAQMQAGFQLLRPTQTLAKWVGAIDRADDAASRESFAALEAWAGDNIPFPGAAYETYIRELYQENRLVQGRHFVQGRRVDLGQIRCPVISVVTSRDVICPPPSAKALLDACGSEDKELLTVPGGHVGAVVGGRAPTVLYPALCAWFGRKLQLPPV